MIALFNSIDLLLFNSIPTNTFGILFTMFLANFLFTRFNFLKSSLVPYNLLCFESNFTPYTKFLEANNLTWSIDK